MLHTLADARQAVRRFVDNGTCDNTIVDSRINEALERLMDAEDYECLRKVMRVSVCNRAFALPHNVEKILHVDICGTPARTFGQAYQFLSSGPGDLDCRWGGSCYQDLADKGDDWPVMFDVPKQYEVDNEVFYPEGMVLAAFSTEEADIGATLRIRGYRADATEVGAGANPGEDLVVQQWTSGEEGLIVRSAGVTGFTTTTNEFQDVTRVLKPQTVGYVSLYAIDPVNDFFFLLAKYHPLQTIPQFRRYNVTNHTVGVKANLLLMVRMRFVPLVHEDDIVPLDSLQAIKLMVMAIREEDAMNVDGATALEAKARHVMGKREEARTMTDGTPIILNVDYRTSLGRKLRRRVNI